MLIFYVSAQDVFVCLTLIPKYESIVIRHVLILEYQVPKLGTHLCISVLYLYK